jgi:hypothetical protein
MNRIHQIHTVFAARVRMCAGFSSPLHLQLLTLIFPSRILAICESTLRTANFKVAHLFGAGGYIDGIWKIPRSWRPMDPLPCLTML